MSYTTIQNVAGMFPAFQRGTPQQKPSDSLIQQYIDDVASDLNAILDRRFGETIRQNFAGSFAAFQAALSPDALNLLEKINRYGAASQLGLALATMGVASAERLARDFESEFRKLCSDLSALNDQGDPASGGLYDHLFDIRAATPSPRAGLQGTAGGDQPKDQTCRDRGLSNFFGKFDKL
jgi:plasmid stabilization system protein ParE